VAAQLLHPLVRFDMNSVITPPPALRTPFSVQLIAAGLPNVAIWARPKAIEIIHFPQLAAATRSSPFPLPLGGHQNLTPTEARVTEWIQHR
jgi:hypothetical protein